jgi:hypothetical protein
MNTVTEAEIRQLFQDWLGREPSAEDIANAAGQTFEAVKAGVVNSPEHTSRWTGQVSAWYRDLLGREPSAAEVNSHYTADNLNDIQRVLKTLQDSPEYKARVAAGAVPAASAATTTTTPRAPGAYNTSLHGFDATKFADSTHNTIKYQFARIAARYPATAAGYAQLVADPDLAALGFKGDGKGNIIATKDLGTVKKDEVIDVMMGFNAGGQGWWWGAGAGAGGGGGNNSGDGGTETLNTLASAELRQPFGETFTTTPWEGSGALGEGGWFDQNAPTPFTYTDFVPPTEADMRQDPSYQTRLAEGQRQIDASAAARGSLLTGGTLKALAQYGQDQASKEYANVYARNLNTWGTNQGNAKDEYAAAFTDYQNAFNQNVTKDATSYRDWLANYNRTYNEFNNRYRIWNEQQTRQFDQMYKLANLGATTA